MSINNIFRHVAQPLITRVLQLKTWEKRLDSAGIPLLILGAGVSFYTLCKLARLLNERRVAKLDRQIGFVGSRHPLACKTLREQHAVLKDHVNKVKLRTDIPNHWLSKRKKSRLEPIIELDATAKELLTKESKKQSIEDFKAHLAQLHQDCRDSFFQLFKHALKTENNNLISACLDCVKKEELIWFLQVFELFDFVLEFENSAIPLNKALLAAKSHYFASLFASGMSDAKNDRICIEKFSFETFVQAIDFLFFGKLQISEDNLEESLDLADFYGFDAITSRCDGWICRRLRCFDKKELYNLTCKYGLERTTNALARAILVDFLTNGQCDENQLLLWLRNATYLDLSYLLNRFPTAYLELCQNVKKLDARSSSWVRADNLRFLSQLPQLKSLNLSSCDISNITNIAHLTNLRKLNISCYYSTLELSPLKDLIFLKKLYLSHALNANYKALENLTNLKKLSFRAESLSALTNPSRIKKLYLIDDPISRSVLHSFVNLESLTFEGNLDNLDLSTLSKLHTLVCSHASDKNLSEIVKLQTLKQLKITFINTKNLSHLQLLSQLEYLHLSGKNASDLSPLATLTELRELSLEYFKLTSVQPLSQLTKLQRLNLYKVKVKDISSFSYLVGLKFLEMRINKLITDLKPLSPLKNLKKLNLHGCKKIDDFTPLSHLTNLRDLCLVRCQISDLTPLASLKKLRHLNIYYTPVKSLAPLEKAEYLEIYASIT